MIMLASAFLLGMILCLLGGVPYIDFLKKKNIGQYVKDCAPETHAQKQGTPTTGGVFIVLAVMLASIVTLAMAQRLDMEAFIILLTLLFYTIEGFQDDYLKIKGKTNDGLSAKAKLFRQIAFAMLPIVYLLINNHSAFDVTVGSYVLHLGWFYPVFAICVITGASNAYNLTDGLDGLAASTGIFAFLACSVVSLYSNSVEAAIISAAVAGALLGFLKYNKPKAQVFMGDTGSLALGGLLGTVAVLGKFEILLVLIAGVFVMETLSVIIQVISFKTTGKRVFKMSPIHHHFEKCDWSEKKIVVVFALVSAICALVSVILFFRGII